MSALIDQEMHALNARYASVGGLYGALSLIMWPGRWGISSAGGSPRVTAYGASFGEALDAAKSQLDDLGATADKLAQTIGIIEAAR